MTGLVAPPAAACERVTIRRVPPVTYVLVAEIPPEGVAAFAEYETAVLPLLDTYGGRLERRLRSPDGCFETHVLTFPHEAALAAYRGDARRDALAPLLRRSAAATQLHQVEDVWEP